MMKKLKWALHSFGFLGFLFNISIAYAFEHGKYAESSKHAERGKTIAYPMNTYATYPKINPPPGEEGEWIKKGEYLAKAGDCIACHSDPLRGGKAFAGNLPIETPFGTFYSPNITPDKKTGIGLWTFEDFVRALRHGKAPSGENYFPVFPYIYYSILTDDDLKALWAYLQHIPAVEQTAQENTVPFPFSWRFAQYGWKLLFFYPYANGFKADPKQSGEWNRGAYLVEGLGHCAMCHSPLNVLGAEKRSYHLKGTFINDFWAPNITQLGLEMLSIEQIVDVFKKNQLPFNAGRVSGGMAEVNHDSLHYLNDSDLRAIAVYLKTVIAKEHLGISADQSRKKADSSEKLSHGKEVFYSACHICHQKGEVGAPIIGDKANWTSRLQENGKALFYKHAFYGYNLMPMKGACVTCNEDDIKAAVDYVVMSSVSRDLYAAYEKTTGPVVEKKPGDVNQDPKTVYLNYCAACHDKGIDGAPKQGDYQAWEARINNKNFDEILHHVLMGTQHKVVKENCPSCSVADIKAVIKYLLKENHVPGNYSLW